MQKKSFAALDAFRLIAALLVVAIHTSPLASLSPDADFLLTRVAGRLAVPFFFMVTGCFLLNDGGVRRFLGRTARLYALSIALYLPLNLYAGGMSAIEWLRGLLIEGTFYHLWYLPAVLLAVPDVYKRQRSEALAASLPSSASCGACARASAMACAAGWSSIFTPLSADFARSRSALTASTASSSVTSPRLPPDARAGLKS